MSNNSSTKTPMFVSFGFDDNGYSGNSPQNSEGGVKWACDLFKKYGSASFFLASHFITEEAPEPSELIVKEWTKLLVNGHDVGNHTHSHSNGLEFTQEQWETEILKCEEILLSSSKGISHKKEELIGFRAPYLAHNHNTIQVLQKLGYMYDCSMAEGWELDGDGTNFKWPYRVDGLWEMPCYPVIIPPDELCAKYGLKPGVRASKVGIGPEDEPFDIKSGKITGLDYNMVVSFKMNKAEFLGTLKYTFDLKMEGNRCPMLFGAHTDYYVPTANWGPNITPKEMREAVEEFLEYVSSFDDVEIVSFRDVINWMESH